MAWTTPTSPNLADFTTFVQTGMGIPTAALLSTMTPPPAPALSAATGGSLPSGTVYVVATYLSQYGETLASLESNVAVIGPTGQVTVTSPSSVTGATGYNVYAASTSGAEALQNSSPIAIGTNYTIDALAAGTATPPAVSTANSPWIAYALNRALNLVMQIPTIAGLDYTLAVYNCAGHILIGISPDQASQSYFTDARKNFGMLEASSGVISSSSDQATSNSFAVPEVMTKMTVGDLYFFKTPWGREYLAFAQDFGAIAGMS